MLNAHIHALSRFCVATGQRECKGGKRRKTLTPSTSTSALNHSITPRRKPWINSTDWPTDRIDGWAKGTEKRNWGHLWDVSITGRFPRCACIDGWSSDRVRSKRPRPRYFFGMRSNKEKQRAFLTSASVALFFFCSIEYGDMFRKQKTNKRNKKPSAQKVTWLKIQSCSKVSDRRDHALHRQLTADICFLSLSLSICCSLLDMGLKISTDRINCGCGCAASP